MLTFGLQPNKSVYAIYHNCLEKKRKGKKFSKDEKAQKNKMKKRNLCPNLHLVLPTLNV